MSSTFYVCDHPGCGAIFPVDTPGVYIQRDRAEYELGRDGTLIIRCADHAGDEAVVANEGRGLADQTAAALLARPNQQRSPAA